MSEERKRRWRDYRTGSSPGQPAQTPVLQELKRIESKSRDDANLISQVMKRVAVEGKRSRRVRHLRGEIHEVRVPGDRASYRVLFAAEGRHQQIYLSLLIFEKKSMRTPPKLISLAEARLKDWRLRGKNEY